MRKGENEEYRITDIMKFCFYLKTAFKPRKVCEKLCTKTLMVVNSYWWDYLWYIYFGFWYIYMSSLPYSEYILANERFFF